MTIQTYWNLARVFRAVTLGLIVVSGVLIVHGISVEGLAPVNYPALVTIGVAHLFLLLSNYCFRQIQKLEAAGHRITKTDWIKQWHYASAGHRIRTWTPARMFYFNVTRDVLQGDKLFVVTFHLLGRAFQWNCLS